MKKWLLFILFIFSLFCFLIIKLEFYFNFHSSSMPLGMYRRVYEKPQKQTLAATCLTKEIANYGLEKGYLIKGRCPTGIQPVLKKIYAQKGDTVSFADAHIAINGKIINKFNILDKDSKGRDVKSFTRGTHVLKDNEYILLSDYKVNSWDSRYWGAVPIELTLEPFLIFE